MGRAVDYELKGQARLSSAQLVQGMKALQEVAVTGSWEVGWEHTPLPDPTKARRHGAREEEVEAVLGYVKMRKDLDATLTRVATGKAEKPQADWQNEDAREEEGQQKPKWWKTKKERKKQKDEE